MKKLTLFLIVMWMVGMIAAMPLQAEIYLRNYDELKENEEFKFYIAGVGKGYFWANSWLTNKNKPPIYCQPANLGLGRSNYMDILKREIQDNNYPLDTPVELILRNGLQRTFPCVKQ